MLKPCAILLFAATSLHAQGMTATTFSPVGDVTKVWDQTSGYILRAAEAVPDSSYGFKPTADVRSFGQLIAHVAGAQRMICAVALGEKAPAEDDIEKTQTRKAELVQSLRASNSYCARAYAMSPADAGGTVDFFGAPQSKMYVLMSNAMHDNEHYGNIVTYMRLKGMVPPSSQPSR